MEDSQGGLFDWKVEDSLRKIGKLDNGVWKTGEWRKDQGGLIFWRLKDSPRRIDRQPGERRGLGAHCPVFGVYDKYRIAVALQPLPYVGGVYLETSAYIPRYAKTLEKWGGGGFK